MSLVTPTTKDISDNIIAQLEASLNQTIPLLPKSFTRVLAKAMAAVFVLLYKYGGFIFLQIFVQTASNVDTEINGKTVNPLIEWGRLIGVGDPTPATSAQLLVDINVETQTGVQLEVLIGKRLEGLVEPGPDRLVIDIDRERGEQVGLGRCILWDGLKQIWAH